MRDDAAGPLSGRRVLLVEDEYVIAVEMERVLQAAGVEVVGPVPSVEQALDLIEEASAAALDAAVLDIDLGNGETAYPVAERLDALGVPYLFATGALQAGGGALHGARPHLHKPVLAGELTRAVAALLKG